MKKARTAKEAQELAQIPNIGPAMVKDFALLGIRTPEDLKKQGAFKLYQKLCKKTGVRHDPCVLDTFLAAVDFMNGAQARTWWEYTEGRKGKYKNAINGPFWSKKPRFIRKLASPGSLR